MRIGTETILCPVIMGMLGKTYAEQDWEAQRGLVDRRRVRMLALYELYVHNLEASMKEGRMSHDTQVVREARNYHRQLNLERGCIASAFANVHKLWSKLTRFKPLLQLR